MTMTHQGDYALRAETRAVEHGRHAFLNDDGSLSVKSESHPDVTYTVTYRTVDLLIKFDCDCASGRYRGDNLFVPCWHSALAGRRLEREGLAHWVDGYWLLTDKARDLMGRKRDDDSDPLRGLPGCESPKPSPLEGL